MINNQQQRLGKFYCIHCHQVGGYDQFTVSYVNPQCFNLNCHSCGQNTGVLSCVECKRLNFMNSEELSQGKIFSCFCKLNYRLFPCIKCSTILLVSKRENLYQNDKIICPDVNCQQVQTIVNCIFCGLKLSMQEEITKNTEIHCTRCHARFKYDRCPVEGCSGELFTEAGQKSVCGTNKTHRFEQHQCVACQNKIFTEKREQVMVCKVCKTQQLTFNCPTCHYELSCSAQNKIQQQSCPQCKEFISIQKCPNCVEGIHSIAFSWLKFVQQNKKSTPTPFIPRNCSNSKCKTIQSAFFCKHCENLKMFEGSSFSIKCDSCKRPYEPVEGSVQLCPVCLDKPVDTVLLECGHVCFCKTCLEIQMQQYRAQCIICRKECKNYMKVYFA